MMLFWIGLATGFGLGGMLGVTAMARAFAKGKKWVTVQDDRVRPEHGGLPDTAAADDPTKSPSERAAARGHFAIAGYLRRKEDEKAQEPAKVTIYEGSAPDTAEDPKGEKIADLAFEGPADGFEYAGPGLIGMPKVDTPREAASRVLCTVAADGLPLPKDLDAALDAIESAYGVALPDAEPLIDPRK